MFFVSNFMKKTEAEASEDKDDLKTSSLLLEEEELNIQLALHLSVSPQGMYQYVAQTILKKCMISLTFAVKF